MANVEVNIFSMSGDSIRRSVEPTCTIGELKAELESSLGIPRHHQKLLAGAECIPDNEAIISVIAVQDSKGDQEEKIPTSPICLTLVQVNIQVQDFELLQTTRDDSCGVTTYVVIVKHIPTGTSCEHDYCCYHPMAGPVRPDPVTGLAVQAVDTEFVVKWEWSENSFDLASAGSIFRRPISMQGGKLVWAGPCKSEKRVRPKILTPPPAVPLTVAEEVRAGDITYHVSDEDDIVFNHHPSSSTVEYSASTADRKSYQNATFSQAGGYVRFECLILRWSESGERGASQCTVFLRMRDGQLALA